MIDAIEEYFLAILITFAILCLIGVIAAGTMAQNENWAEFRRVCIESGKSVVVEDLDPRPEYSNVWVVCK